MTGKWTPSRPTILFTAAATTQSVSERSASADIADGQTSAWGGRIDDADGKQIHRAPIPLPYTTGRAIFRPKALP